MRSLRADAVVDIVGRYLRIRSRRSTAIFDLDIATAYDMGIYIRTLNLNSTI